MPNFVPLYWEGDGAHPSPNYGGRASFYGVGGIPHVQFGGYIEVVGGGGDMYPNYLSKYNMLENDDSPLSIIQTVNVAGGNIIMQANVTVTDNITREEDSEIITVIVNDRVSVSIPSLTINFTICSPTCVLSGVPLNS